MPIYEYECPKCGVFEEMQSISADARKRCPTCRSKVTKLISQTAFHLRGGGWYSDGYEKKDGSSKSSSDASSSSGSTASTTKTESKKTESKKSDSGKSASSKKSSGKSSQSAA